MPGPVEKAPGGRGWAVSLTRPLRAAAATARDTAGSTREALTVLAVFSGLTLALTWPGILSPFSRVLGSPEGGDLFVAVWNLWWAKTALLGAGERLYFSGWMFHPFGVNLALHDYPVLLAVLSIPFQRWGLIFAYNVAVWLTFVLSGVAAYGLARELGSGRAGGTFAGALFAFSAYRFAHLPEHLGLLATFGMPAYAWSLVRLSRCPAASPFLVLTSAGLVGANLFLNYTYFLYCLLFGLSFGVWLWVVERWTWRRLVVTIGAPLVLGTLPAVWLLVQGVRGGVVAEHLFMSDRSSRIFNGVSLLDYVTPSILHPVRRALIGGETFVFAGDFEERTVYLGLVPLALSCVGLGTATRAPRGKVCVAFGLLALGLSLEPVFRNGLMLALRWVGSVPLVHHLRVPTRFSVLVLLMVAVIAAHGYTHLLARLPHPTTRRLVGGGILALVLFEHAAVPVPVTRLTASDGYRRLGAVSGDFAVLELPLGWSSGGPSGVFDHESLYFQTIHGKRIVGGYVSRAPAATLAMLRSEPTIAALLRAQDPHAPVAVDELSSHAQEAAALAERWGLRFVVIRHSQPRRYLQPEFFDANRLERVAQVLFRLEPWYKDGEVWIYRIVRPSAA